MPHYLLDSPLVCIHTYNLNHSKSTTIAKRGKVSKTKAKVDAGKGNSGTIISALRSHPRLIGPGGGVGGRGLGTGIGPDTETGPGSGSGKSGGPTTLAAAKAKAEEKRR